MENEPSIISLVVPATSVTIAFSSFKSALSKLDFPTFGLPRITTLTPSFIILLLCEFLRTLLIELVNSSSLVFTLFFVVYSMSSSG